MFGICQFTQGQVPRVCAGWRAAAWPVAQPKSQQLLIFWLLLLSAACGLSAARGGRGHLASPNPCLSGLGESSRQWTGTAWHLFAPRGNLNEKNTLSVYVCLREKYGWVLVVCMWLYQIYFNKKH